MAGMAERGYYEAFAASIVGQIRGFAEYGFPESHAASFALLAYASSWLKCYKPEAFLAALLNSQPMGFYSASQLVQDGRRHGVTVLPVDVAVTGWEASLEPQQGDRPAVRLGLNQVHGLEREAAWRIEEARSVAAFRDLHDLALRANVAQRDLTLVASADALAVLAGNRREALWSAAGGASGKGVLKSAAIAEDHVPLQAPTESENTLSDYRHLGLTLGKHPMTFLRERLYRQRFTTAEDLRLF